MINLRNKKIEIIYTKEKSEKNIIEKFDIKNIFFNDKFNLTEKQYRISNIYLPYEEKKIRFFQDFKENTPVLYYTLPNCLNNL